MKIQKIYEKYKIMPQLQLHMLKVAGVASIICDNFENKVDKNSIISACLLHDMGNVVKSKIGLFPDLEGKKGINYWEKVKNNFIENYGKDAHKVTLQILKEVSTNDKIYNFIKSKGFINGKKICASKNNEIKIFFYSDLRASPYGVVTLEKRLDEGIKRNIKNRGSFLDENKLTSLISYWIKIEKQIFAKCKIKPEDISDKNVNPLLKNLRNFNIPVN